MLFNANIAVLRGVARCGFGQKYCLRLQGQQRPYIIPDVFVSYVTFPLKAITYSVVHLMEVVMLDPYLPFIVHIPQTNKHTHTQEKC